MTRLYYQGALCYLPMARIFIATPGRRVWFKLHNDIDQFGQRGVIDFATEVFELIGEELRPHVFAEWCNPRERFALEQRKTA